MKLRIKIKSSIRIFKRWLNKPNRTSVSPYEDEIIKIFRKIIYSDDSKCFVDLKLSKRYIDIHKQLKVEDEFETRSNLIDEADKLVNEI